MLIPLNGNNSELTEIRKGLQQEPQLSIPNKHFAAKSQDLSCHSNGIAKRFILQFPYTIQITLLRKIDALPA